MTLKTFEALFNTPFGYHFFEGASFEGLFDQPIESGFWLVPNELIT